MINQEDQEKVQAKMKDVKDVKSYKKLEIIAFSGEGLTDVAIAEKKCSNIEFVRNVRKRFCVLVIDNFLSDGRKGRNHTIFSPEIERASRQLINYCTVMGTVKSCQDLNIQKTTEEEIDSSKN